MLCSLQWRHNDHDSVSHHLSVVYSIVYSGTRQRKPQSSALLAFVRVIHRSPVNSPHKGPVTRKMFPFDDVIMGIWIKPDVYMLNTRWPVTCLLATLSYITNLTGSKTQHPQKYLSWYGTITLYFFMNVVADWLDSGICQRHTFAIYSELGRRSIMICTGCTWN